MSMTNINQEFTEYLYNRLPKVYRTSDKEQILRRFIESFVEGGFQPLLQETINIMDLLDVDKCPSRFLPQLCRMYGYEYTLEIPELFQRRLLKHIVDMYKRKGTKSVVRFIARELTGFDSEIIENKDFNDDHVAITKWDRRFEHYRNFILKLTAPYENSALFNKEDIVVKILNDFLPTNSQVFLITVYWFKEESEIVKQSIEECVYEALKDYQGDIKSQIVATGKDDEVYRKLKHKDEEYVHGFYAEEESYLNETSGIPLFTNTVLRVRDTIKFARELYDSFLNLMELEGKDILILSDLENYNILSNTSYNDTQKVKYNLEALNLTILGEEELKDVTKENTHIAELTLNKEEEIFKEKLVKDIFTVELNQSSRTLEVDCDIIKTLLGNFSYNYMENNLRDNSTLNVGNLYTNGIMSYDIIKEVGKPDRIILL